MLRTITDIIGCLPRSTIEGLHLAVKFVGRKDGKLYMESSVAEERLGQWREDGVTNYR